MNQQLQVRAHAVKHEWIEDAEGDICIRPMLFDSEGFRITRHSPDAVEFVSITEAYLKLVRLEKQLAEDDFWGGGEKPYED